MRTKKSLEVFKKKKEVPLEVQRAEIQAALKELCAKKYQSSGENDLLLIGSPTSSDQPTPVLNYQNIATSPNGSALVSGVGYPFPHSESSAEGFFDPKTIRRRKDHPTQVGRSPLSNNLRRLPEVFLKQRINVRDIELVLAQVTQTLRILEFNYLRSSLESEGEKKKKKGKGSFSGDFSGARLDDITTVDEIGISYDENNRQRQRDAARWERVRRARVTAADEGASDQRSEDDYSAEPEVPYFIEDTLIREEIESIATSLDKIKSCVDMLVEMDELTGLPWWSSAMRTRDLKSITVRCNYHCRRAACWSSRSQEHLLLRAVHLNDVSDNCRRQLLHLKAQIDCFSEQIDESAKKTTMLSEEAASLQEVLRKQNITKTQLQEEMLRMEMEIKVAETKARRVQQRRLWESKADGSSCSREELAKGESTTENDNDEIIVGTNDVLAAELHLLIRSVPWPPEFQEDANRVRQWLCEHSVSLA